MIPKKPLLLLLAMALFTFCEVSAFAVIEALPAPPQQSIPWIPASSQFEPALLAGMAKLFELGFADPRGCNYQEIEIAENRGPSIITNRVHGWMIPQSRSQKQRYAVGWDGLVHPVMKSGRPASLSQDVEQLFHFQTNVYKMLLASTNDWTGWNFEYWIFPESNSLSETNLTDIKIMLLLRLGETQLAEQYWQNRNAIHGVDKSDHSEQDPFYDVAWNWTAATFERAVAMHVCGNDALSLSDCQMLSKVRPVVADILNHRPSAAKLHWDNRPYFQFLENLPELLADEQRRVTETQRKSGSSDVKNDFGTGQQKIEAAIMELENVSSFSVHGSGWKGNRGYVSLVAEGDAAVESLLRCMEHDHRLTRDIYTKYGPLEASFIPVREVAIRTLEEILQVQFDEPSDYKSYWQKYRSVPMVERWYLTLADDAAGSEQWHNAALNALSRSHAKQDFVWGNALMPSVTNSWVYKYIKLRQKHDPSVSELLRRRALEMTRVDKKSNNPSVPLDYATDLGLMLAEWDPAYAAPTLAKVLQVAIELENSTVKSPYSKHISYTNEIAILTTSLANLGNRQGPKSPRSQ